MTFWIIIAGLLIPALLCLMLPILRSTHVQHDVARRQQQNIQIAREKKAQLDQQRDRAELNQHEYDEALQELQRSLALDLQHHQQATIAQQPGQWLAWFIAAVVPVLSISLYLGLGEYRVIQDPMLAQVGQIQRGNTANSQDMSIETMLARLRQRLQDHPEDAQGWFILGQTLKSMQQIDQAVAAFRRTHALVGDQPGILFTLADALALQNKGSLAGEATGLIKRGLDIAPANPTGLWLVGLAAEQRREYKLAHSYWRKLLPLIAQDAESSAEIRRLLAVLEQRDPSIDSTTAMPAPANLNLTIDLHASLQDQVEPTDVVFVYAKAMQGPPMPLAVKKLTVADLPAHIQLGDADAMMPNMKLSAFDQVIVGARVAKTGKPVAQPGDLFIEMDSIDRKKPPPDLSLLISQVK